MLRGNLGTVPITDVFQMLAMGRRAGCVLLERKGTERKIFVDQTGFVTYVESNAPRERLGFYLSRDGGISEDQLDALRDLERQTGQKTAVLLVENNFIGEAQLAKALNEQFQFILTKTLRMRRGEFTFVENQLPPENAANFKVSLQELILEGLRISDEYDLVLKKLGGWDQRYQRNTKAMSQATLSGQQLEILFSAEKPVRVKDFIQKMQGGEMGVLEDLNHLLEKDLLVACEGAAARVELVPAQAIEWLKEQLVDRIGPMAEFLFDEATIKVADDGGHIEKKDWAMALEMIVESLDRSDALYFRERFKERKWL